MRVYSYGPAARAGWILAGVLLLALGTFCVWAALHEGLGWLPLWLGIGLGGGLILLALYAIASTVRSATILNQDEIIRRDVFRERSMRRRDIAGIRAAKGEYVRAITLVSARPDEVRSLNIYLLRPDEEFSAWFEGIPDLDAQDEQAMLEEALSDPALGETRAARQRAIEEGQRLVTWPNRVGIAVFFWAAAWPRPYEIAVLVAAAAPLVGLALVFFSRGQVSVIDGRARASVGALLWAGTAVALRAFDVEMLDWPEACAAGLLAGVVGVGALWAADRRAVGTWAVAAMLVAPTTVYGWGCLVEANYMLDRRTPEVFQVLVTGKRAQDSGRYLTLAAWGPFGESSEIEVGREFYGRAAVGRPICGYIHPGALEMRWYEYGDCPPPV